MQKQTELDFVATMYDQHGHAYSRRRFTSGLLFNDYIEAPLVRQLIGNANHLEGVNVLDIGCGPGIYSRLLLAAGAQLTAIDSSAVMLEVAKRYCFDFPVKIDSTSAFIHTSFEDANFGQQKFGLILATFMLSYFSDLPSAFKKMKIHLAPGGKIIASMLHPIRMLSKCSNEGYLVSDYFCGGTYDSDFLHDSFHIPLKRYNFEQLHSAIDQAGLKIARLLEPMAIPNCGFHDVTEVEFFSKHPSIVIFQLNLK